MKEFTSTQRTETLPLEFFQWLIAHLQRFEFVIALLARLAFHENMFDFIRTGYVWIYQFNLWFQSKNMQKCCTKSLFTMIFRVNCKGKPIEFLFSKTWHKKTARKLLMRTLLYSYKSSFLILIKFHLRKLLYILIHLLTYIFKISFSESKNLLKSKGCGQIF